jgi:hypothetical protein
VGQRYSNSKQMEQMKQIKRKKERKKNTLTIALKFGFLRDKLEGGEIGDETS